MTYRNATLGVCLNVVLCNISQFAAGATLCVTKNPSPGCPYSTIGAAVAAASTGDVVQVSQGTYKEDVVVGKAISLVGANRNNTIIVIQEETIGIVVKTNALVEAHLNNFVNPVIGVDNIDGGLVDATLNWWGCSRGPTAAGWADISGTNTLYLPFLTKPF